jgi:hypothetical protein
MRTVFSYSLYVDDEIHKIMLPVGARIVHVALSTREYDVVRFWAEVDNDLPMETRIFQVFGTGQPVSGRYVGTTVATSGALVWHLFELTTSR